MMKLRAIVLLICILPSVSLGQAASTWGHLKGVYGSEKGGGASTPPQVDAVTFDNGVEIMVETWEDRAIMTAYTLRGVPYNKVEFRRDAAGHYLLTNLFTGQTRGFSGDELEKKLRWFPVVCGMTGVITGANICGRLALGGFWLGVGCSVIWGGMWVVGCLMGE